MISLTIILWTHWLKTPYMLFYSYIFNSQSYKGITVHKSCCCKWCNSIINGKPPTEMASHFFHAPTVYPDCTGTENMVQRSWCSLKSFVHLKSMMFTEKGRGVIHGPEGLNPSDNGLHHNLIPGFPAWTALFLCLDLTSYITYVGTRRPVDQWPTKG